MLRDRLRGMGREADLQTVPIRPRFGLAAHGPRPAGGRRQRRGRDEPRGRGARWCWPPRSATFLDVTNVLQLTRRLTGRRTSQNVESIEDTDKPGTLVLVAHYDAGAGRARVRIRAAGSCAIRGGRCSSRWSCSSRAASLRARGRGRGAHGRAVRAHRPPDPARARARRHRAVGGLPRRGRQRRRRRRRARPRRRAGRTPRALRPVGGPHRRASSRSPWACRAGCESGARSSTASARRWSTCTASVAARSHSAGARGRCSRCAPIASSCASAARSPRTTAPRGTTGPAAGGARAHRRRGGDRPRPPRADRLARGRHRRSGRAGRRARVLPRS